MAEPSCTIEELSDDSNLKEATDPVVIGAEGSSGRDAADASAEGPSSAAAAAAADDADAPPPPPAAAAAAATATPNPSSAASTSTGQQQQQQQAAAAGAAAAATTAPDVPPPMSPPPGAEPVTPDGGVLKTTVAPGAGDPPPLHARCLVHYACYVAATGEKVVDTRTDTDAAEPAVLVAGRDASLRDVGLQLALARMRRGERAWVHVTDPKYGYGARGSFSFPSVPPDAALAYDATLLEFEPPDDRLDRRGMLFEERLEAAERRRREGNALFADGKLTEALGKYALALSYVDEDTLLQLEGPHLDLAQAVLAPIHLNMAAAQLKLGDYSTAAHNATQALARDAGNAKALFRRGRARAALGQTEDALADLEAAAKAAPGDPAVARELAALRRAQREERAASARLFRGALGARPTPKPGDGIGGSSGGSGAQMRAGGGGGTAQGVLGVLLAAAAALMAWLFNAARRALGRAAA